ncbi:MAG TPA: glucose-6-phosphate dehydrogenase assembly protein OpcA [Rhabdochlamydiaceae bacterium]
MQVSEIPAALVKLWDAMEGTNKMRASLFNLLVVAPKNQRTDYVRTITLKVLERFPSRVIFTTIDKTLSGDSLNASVSLIPGAKGSYDVVCDLIELETSKQAQAKVPFVILPHLLPDLPLYILWAEDPVQDNPISHQLEKWATRIIFDSEVTDNLPAFAKTLLEHAEDCEIADLNWGRLESWRELLASTFYSQDRLETLKKAQKICITYNAYETPFFCHTKIQAVYLQSWLITQLGWKLTKSEKDLFHYGSLTIELKAAKNQDLPPGTVISLDIFTSTDVHFAFSRDPAHPYQIRTLICDIEKCEIPTLFIFSKAKSGLSLVNEITHNGTSPHFLKVLEFLSKQDNVLC